MALHSSRAWAPRPSCGAVGLPKAAGGTTLCPGIPSGFLPARGCGGLCDLEQSLGRLQRTRRTRQLARVATARGRHRSEKPGGAVGAVAVAPGTIENGRMGGTWKDGALFSHGLFLVHLLNIVRNTVASARIATTGCPRRPPANAYPQSPVNVNHGRRNRGNRRRPHRMDPDLLCAGEFHDAGAGLLLRRPRAAQPRAARCSV